MVNSHERESANREDNNVGTYNQGLIGGSSGQGGKALYFFFQAEDGIRTSPVTGVQTCALPICDFGILRAGVTWPPPPEVLLLDS